MNNIIGEPLLFNLFYFVKDKSLREAVYEADETTPEFRNIHIKNITSTGSNKAMVFNGLPEKVIRNVTVENANIRSRYGAEMNCCENITLKNVIIIPEQGEPFIFSNVEGLVRN